MTHSPTVNRDWPYAYAWTNRGTVENCIAFLCATRQREFISSPAGTEVEISFSSDPPRPMLGPVNCVIVANSGGERAIMIPREFFDRPGASRLWIGQIINLCTTKPHFGGTRYWFTCRCGRRVGRLYVAEGETRFRCRRCHGWTYRSCQEHNTIAQKERELIEWFREGL